MFNSSKFFDQPTGFSVLFKSGDGGFLFVGIGEIDIMPLLMVLVLDLHGFVDVVIFGFKIIRSELDLHTVGRPWPLEDGQ